MIIITIGGGLGNQMFQYAFYTKMKHCYPDEIIKLDIYNSFQEVFNGYELERIFGLRAEECSVEEVAMLSDYYPVTGKNYQFHRIVCKIKRVLGIHKKSFREQEDYVGYSDDYLDLERGQSYLFRGAFANARYFSDIKEEIMKIYSFPEIEDTKNILLARKIMESESVSIHVRRGDYEDLGIEMTQEVFYRNAMRYIENEVGERVQYFVFSDDLVWVKEHFSDVKNLEIVSGNEGENSFRDMQLMSLCKHNIIANSTFSFWGAYLNKNKNKIVVLPNLTFTGSNNLFMDDDWIVLENK